MRIEEKFENIKEFARLSPQDRELVLEEYRKDEHPYQIEYQVWAIIIPCILFGVADFLFKDKLESMSNLEHFGLILIVVGIFYLSARFIVFNLIAPKVIKKIIIKLDKIKKSSNNTFQQTAFRRR